MFCIFTTRAEKRHLVQEMLTKNVEHVKMKKVRTFGIGQKYICGKEDTEMKTAEVLDQTETFETAGFDILNHVGKITQVDMPMEYGRVCLAEQVGKHAALFLAGVSLLAFEVYAFYIKSVARSFYSQLLLLWIPMRTKFPLCFLSAFFLMLFLIPFI